LTEGTATASAGVNFALIKYWGKRDVQENLPAVGSLSLTLASPGTTTTVTFDPTLPSDTLTLDGRTGPDRRVSVLLDEVRAHAGGALQGCPAWVDSRNTVRTAAGLASSASGFAALGVAAWAAAGLDPFDGGRPSEALVDQVRRGSGSAPRSLLGGLVELDRESGRIRQHLDAEGWDLRIVIALTAPGRKDVSSRAGMASSEATSAYYPAWVETHEADLEAARVAIASRDLEGLGVAMERSTLKMHACMMAGDPALLYWRGATVEAVHAVRALRAGGTGAWFTMDAGPHVKVLCAAADAEAVAAVMRRVPGVEVVEIAAPGPGARLVEADG
jgi:diphosphomevalonate decarboxylase